MKSQERENEDTEPTFSFYPSSEDIYLITLVDLRAVIALCIYLLYFFILIFKDKIKEKENPQRIGKSVVFSCIVLVSFMLLCGGDVLGVLLRNPRRSEGMYSFVFTEIS